MLHRDLAKVIHQDRLREAREIRGRREYHLAANLERSEARARKRKLRRLRREAHRAHRATLGAFVAFGDGLSSEQERRTTSTSGRR